MLLHTERKEEERKKNERKKETTLCQFGGLYFTSEGPNYSNLKVLKINKSERELHFNCYTLFRKSNQVDRTGTLVLARFIKVNTSAQNNEKIAGNYTTTATTQTYNRESKYLRARQDNLDNCAAH